eukprot:7006977-Prymnesium_polylepis.1
MSTMVSTWSPTADVVATTACCVCGTAARWGRRGAVARVAPTSVNYTGWSGHNKCQTTSTHPTRR